MTATDELRRLLDERGVFWVDIPRKDMTRTVWKESDGQLGYCYFDENEFGVTTLLVSSPTPEHAIAATLGRGTCEADETDTIKCWVKCKDKPSVEHMELIHVMECSECGHTYEHVNGDYEFCPRCGRKRVDE